MIDYIPGNTNGFKVTERGIEQIVKDYGNGFYSTQVVIPKETFLEAYFKWIERRQNESQ